MRYDKPNRRIEKTEIPFEGDIFDFGFTYKLNQYNQNEIIKNNQNNITMKLQENEKKNIVSKP